VSWSTAEKENSSLIKRPEVVEMYMAHVLCVTIVPCTVQGEGVHLVKITCASTRISHTSHFGCFTIVNKTPLPFTTV
jgi:hypothetical protein